MTKPTNEDWYKSLNKSKLVPPNWVFGAVWSTLYVMIAFSLYFYLIANEFKWTDGLMFFCVQMFCNLIWPSLFFRFKMVAAACADCILMIFFLLLTIK